MNYQDIDIMQILPQGKDFVMVDTLVSWSLEVTVTRLTVRADNHFCRNGVLTAGGLVENIAQTSAARIGYYHRYVLHTSVEIGFIGAVQNMMIGRLPALGETITTRIEVKAEAFGMLSLEARITDADGNVIAEGMMKTAS